jgi:hypothetical protein
MRSVKSTLHLPDTCDAFASDLFAVLDEFSNSILMTSETATHIARNAAA